MDSWQISLLSLRVVHILAGIMFVGSLYFLNFFRPAANDSAARAPGALTPRMLDYFRWAAMITFIAGVVWMFVYAGRVDGYFTVSNKRFLAILIGGGLGTVMVLNTWGIIWPTQRRVAASQMQPHADQVRARWLSRITIASRLNVVLSFPMLTFMVIAGHTGGA